MISMTTDYVTSIGCPEPYLRRIAEAGYTHVHWCHHWADDFVYSRPEVSQIKRWLKELGLGVTDIHGSGGNEKLWMAPEEYSRKAGVELVANRIRMAARLGSDVVIMHIPQLGDPAEDPNKQWEPTRRTFEDLEPIARKCGVRIAIENIIGSSFDDFDHVFSLYPPDYIGLCYDSGHGNCHNAIEHLDKVKDRLISLHLHDNDGKGDQHQIPFQGTVDWPRLAQIIAQSPYGKWVSMESIMANTGIQDEAEYLARAYDAGTRFSQMIAQARGEESPNSAPGSK